MDFSNNDSIHIGILAAMPEEIGLAVDNLSNVEIKEFGDLTLYSGFWKILNGKNLFLTIGWSGWGKVSAARSTIRLLASKYNNKEIDLMIFTGVAGALKSNLKQWDIVLAESLVQHDMDARPIFEKYVVPVLGSIKLSANYSIIENIFTFLKSEKENNNLGIFGEVYKGLLATGDSFISNKEQIIELIKDFPELYAVEMEGAAFAQVCFQEKIDWIVIRIISDCANNEASLDFSEFLKKYKYVSWDLIEKVLYSLKF